MAGVKSDCADRSAPGVAKSDAQPREGLSTDLAQKCDRVVYDWADVILWRVHPIQVFAVEALCWIERPLSATELRELCGRAVGVDSISFHLRQLAKLRIVEPVAKLKVRQSQGRERETFFFLANDRSWVSGLLRQDDPSDHLAAVASDLRPSVNHR